MRPDEAPQRADCEEDTVAMNNTFQNDRDLAMRMSLRQRQVIISTALGLNCDADITRFAIRAGLVRP